MYLCTNATGRAKIPMSIIGKSENPRCFKGKNVPVKYFAQKNAWSDSKTFVRWFEEVFLPFARRHTEGTDDKVLLLMDNCGSHFSLSDCGGRVNIAMFPPKCTSKHQPMDMGVIAATKLHYRRFLLLRRISDLPHAESLRMKAQVARMPVGTRGLDQGYPPHMLDTARMLKLAWGEVDETTIAR